jgi:pimeloyl-ACP methyl ester carboxylesterase
VKKLLAVAATAGLGLTGLGLNATGASATTSAPAGYQPGKLSWHACSTDIVNGAKAFDNLGPVKVSTIIKCAELQVPLDFAHPNGQKITLELTNTPHQGSGPAKGDILVNPGGPGGGGALYGPRVYAQNSAPMQAAYNVIGFDPRGVGFSTPHLTCDVNYSNAPRPEYGTGGKHDDQVWLDKSKAYADSCAANFGKGAAVDLLDHIKTIDSIHDMDVIRAALGHKKLDYYGASYGTYLGQTYATVFPTHVGRFVLDGNVNPKHVWYRTQLDQDVAFDKNLDYYFGWISRFDSTYHLGTTQAAVTKYFFDLEAQLAEHPVTFTSGGSTVAVGPDELVDNIQNAGYTRSQARWNLYAHALSAFKAGDVATFAGTFGAQTTGGADDNLFAVYNAVQCSDTQWPQSFARWQADAVRVNKDSPFLTWGNVWFNAPCLYWPAKPGNLIDVGHTRDLPRNILMFQATDDAATPYKGALELHKVLRGSHLVVQDGDRTHVIVHRGDTRPGGVDSYYDAYFLHGTLPQQDTVHVSQLGDPVPPAASAAKAAPSHADVVR